MPVSGPGTPYVTAQTLVSASDGIAWGTIPYKGALPAEQLAEQMNMCQRASGTADTICRQVLRATADTETFPGPGSTRVNIQRNGNTLITVSRWPVLQVTGVSVALANCWPWQWQAVPAGMFAPAYASPGIYGSSAPSAAGEGKSQVLVAPGWIGGGAFPAPRGWWAPVPQRNACQVQVSYVNGWPHCGTTGTSSPGDTELAVDDCTGWAPVTGGAPGAIGTVQDGGSQETITCTGATVTSGPGTLSLASPLGYGHAPGVVVTTLPQQIQWAVILLAVWQALERGATATTHMQVPGASVSSGVTGQDSAMMQATALLRPFARII